MKVVIAMDSFKGSLSSVKAGNAVKEGINRIYPDSEILVLPVADGGEGTTDALISGLGGKEQKIYVTGPLGEKEECRYGIISESKTAVIEMAQASGLTLIKKENRNPLITTTYGVGEIICDAIKKGCRKFIMGIGGSSTNDGGAGMLQALGFDLVDKNGNSIPFGAEGLSVLDKIKDKNVISRLHDCQFKIACDVKNPLCGKNGCSRIFAPQKGADPDMIQKMDLWMEHYAELAEKYNPQADKNYPGAGAAGGLGFAFLTFMNATLESGVEMILKETKVEEKIKYADLVITGEGCLDIQTSMGKAPAGIAEIAKKYSCPVLAFAGCIRKGAYECHKNGIDAYFSVLHTPVTEEEAMDPASAYSNIADCAEQVMRVWKLRGK